MRKIAKFLSTVLATATVLGSFCFGTSAASFKDVSAKDEALYKAVTLLNSLGIAKGTSETTYGASKKVTREQMAAFVYRLMKEGRSVEGGENLTSFTDLKDDTFYFMISWASENGIIKGRSETIFDPSGSITLQDCYVMVTRALGYEKDETLSYPYGFIDVAETIGLDENLSSKLGYTDELTRGDMAIILYNAFYADMNETYKKAIVPTFMKPGQNVTSNVVYKETNETVCHKIYGVEEIYRRVVATPNYAIDLTGVQNGGTGEYIAYKPLVDEKVDVPSLRTAAIVPEKDSTRLEKEEAVLAFADLGLEGEADDYFLSDLVMYMKKDGTILGVSATGKVTNEAPKAETFTSSDWDTYYVWTDGKNSSDRTLGNTSAEKLRTGKVSFGTSAAYFYDLPSEVPDVAYSLYPVAGNTEGTMVFKADYDWAGYELNFNYDVKSTDSPYDTYTATGKKIGYERTKNHHRIKTMLGTAMFGNYYSLNAYDCNGDGYIDYLWMMPYTWGQIVDKKGDAYKIDNKHTGDSSNRACFDSNKNVPVIYVNGATVEGGTCEDGKFVFAYVSGPAKYVRIADDEISDAIQKQTVTLVQHDPDKNTTKWSNGWTINAWNSVDGIVGHVSWTSGGSEATGIIPLQYDRFAWDQFTWDGGNSTIKNTGCSAFDSNWRASTDFEDEWEIYLYNGSRALFAKRLSDSVDAAKQYAVIQYVNEENKQVVFQAGGIEADGTLQSDDYVYAYIDGKYQMVKQSKYAADGTTLQNDNYYVDGGLVNSVSTYKVDGDGKYTFTKLSFTDADANAADLAGQSASKTYSVTAKNISLDKFVNNVYRFVPNPSSGTLDAKLSPNGMKYVSIEEGAKILVKYTNSDGDSDFRIFDAQNLPDFDADDASMSFTNAYIVLKNRTDSTVTEYLAFMYCEIGGNILDSSDNDNYRILLGSKQIAESDGTVAYRYKGVDPMTGDEYDDIATVKTTSSKLKDFAMFKVNEEGELMNTTTSDAEIKLYKDSNLKALASYEADAKLIFVQGEADAIRVTDKTVFGLLDRKTGEYSLQDADMLAIEKADDVDNEYFFTSKNALQLYMITDDESGEDLDYAKLVIVVRDDA